ncbi:hypothetical protein ACGP04_05765 [Piscirickettsia salmonis]
MTVKMYKKINKMTNEQNKIYCITNLQGIVTFVSRSFLNFYNVEQHHVVGKRANQCVTFPLGCAQAIKDIIDIAREKVTKARREGITISKEGFFVGALHKYPQINDGKIIGIVHETDFSLEQLIHNKCLDVIEKAPYKGQTLNKTDIKLLMVLAHFNTIKASDIAKVFKVKTNTVYIYKNNLINKIKIANNSEHYCYLEVIKHILLHGLYSDGHQYICLPYHELSLFSNTPLKLLKKFTLGLSLPKQKAPSA